MKRQIAIILTMVLALGTVGCGDKKEQENPPEVNQEPVADEDDKNEDGAENQEESYYVGASFNGYEAMDEKSKMNQLEGHEDVYYLTVELTEENMDPTYGAHFYKVTNGTWDADGCWGADNYALSPAPAAPDGAGMGSIYLKEHGTYTIYFNATTQTVADTSFYTMLEPLPHIYGDFNDEMGRGEDWSYEDGLILTDDDFDGIYTGQYTIPAFRETEENNQGYSMAVALKYEYVEDWENWGVTEQYKFDGTEAGMGGVSYYKPDKETTVIFSYNSGDHTTSMEEVQN